MGIKKSVCLVIIVASTGLFTGCASPSAHAVKTDMVKAPITKTENKMSGKSDMVKFVDQLVLDIKKKKRFKKHLNLSLPTFDLGGQLSVA